MTDTVNNSIPFVPENTIDPAAGLNLSLNTIDALLQLHVIGMKVDTPPVVSVAGDRFIVGLSPTGAWSGQPLKLAVRSVESNWKFHEASAAVFGTSIYVNTGSDWVPSTAGAAAAWGGITGAIEDQVDLVAALLAASGVTYVQDSTPASAGEKQTWYNPLTLQLQVYNDAAWRPVSPDGGYF
jgi:hypothetical protein